jgi:beta-lactamase class A
MKRLITACVLAAILGACASGPYKSTRASEMAAISAGIAELDKRSGGRLGVAVTDGEGQLVLGHRADERFAMCSTFKLLLAGQVLEGATNGGPSLRTPMTFSRSDLVSYSPGTEKLLNPGSDTGEQRLGFAAEDMVVLSDNTAANLVLREFGGPSAFTAWLRRQGDMVTRLDRIEPMLNDNAPGDERDTTTPNAMARSAARLIFGTSLSDTYRTTLQEWMVKSVTGLQRIRAGLPAHWRVGDKTGTCRTAYNDVAFVVQPGGERYVIAVYLDRPKLDGAAANRLIADVARVIAGDDIGL